MMNATDVSELKKYFPSMAISNSANTNKHLGLEGLNLNDGFAAKSEGAIGSLSYGLTAIHTPISGMAINVKDVGFSSASDYSLNVINGGSGDEMIMGTEAADVISGNDGSDTISGQGGDDVFYGGSGDDILIGASGNDIFIGGAGNDLYFGLAGDDIYLWDRGVGNDYIYDRNSATPSDIGYDRLILGSGITPEDMVWSRQDDSLILTLNTSGETLRLDFWFRSEFDRVESVELVDGTVLDMDAVTFELAGPAVLEGTDGADFLDGTEFDDIIYGQGNSDFINGMGGDDVLYGGDGDDTLLGGDGNDTFFGGSGYDVFFGMQGNDIYHWGRGEGNAYIYDRNTTDASVTDFDRLIFGPGITATDLVWSREDLSLVATLQTTGETIKLDYWFRSVLDQVESLELSDGTRLDMTSINDWLGGPVVIEGTTGDDSLDGTSSEDVIYGHDGDDVLSGKEGDDVLNGGDGSDFLFGDSGGDYLSGGLGDDLLAGMTGNDIYLWDTGQGNDYILDANLDDSQQRGYDTVRLGPGIAATDIVWSRQNESLILTLHSTGERLTFINWYRSVYDQVESVLLSDGTSLEVAEIGRDLAQPNSIYGTEMDDRFEGTEFADHLHGLGGDDWLAGGAGDDVLYGGDGNDSLIGGDGNDSLFGGLGSDGYLGMAGDDVYYWDVGQGNDYIYDADDDSGFSRDFDRLVLGSGVTESDMTWSRSGDGLLLTLNSTGESLYFVAWYLGPEYQLESVLLSDGSATLDMPQIAAQFVEPAAASSFISQTNLLIDAINAFAPNGGGDLELMRAEYQDDGRMVLAEPVMV